VHHFAGIAGAGAHDTVLVPVSVVIAILASYTALDLATRMRASSGWWRRAWLAGSAVAMGGGIWSMHFIAMLAFSLPGVRVSYDIALTLLSLALPIAVTAGGFAVANRRAGLVTVTASGLFMGLGIAGMHYLGMAAMRMPADLRHDRVWVALSLFIAVGASMAALWLALRHSGLTQRVAAAVVMGLAVSGMHFAAMQGATFAPLASVDFAEGRSSVDQTQLAVWVALTTLLILLLALLIATFDRHFAHLLDREARVLRESEQRFRLLVQSVTDYAIFMLDREGRVANWNAGAARIKGYSAQEIVGQHFSRFYTDDDRSSGVPEQALLKAEHDGKFEAEGWRVRKDGSRFWANVVIDPVRDDDGILVGFAKVTRDITDRREAQLALEKARYALAQAQKMEALGQLTGGVAHDFNNLLMAILASLDLIRKRLPDDPKLRRLLDNAVQGAERGAALTQRMLAFARRQDLNPEPVNLAELAKGMADLLDRSVGPSIKIEARFPEGLPPAIVDANQLELALLNLVVNARDAIPSGGIITIAGREEADTSGKDRHFVVLSVQDTGTGMDQATLSRAKEPFFTTKGIGKGTGLGLSMVHGLAEQSNGRLELHSAPGIGTTAEIWLPKSSAEPARVSPPKAIAAASSAGRPRLTVLVVDDDELVLENTVAMLEDLGHSAVPARSAAVALTVLQSLAPDVVLTDQVMPEMTGAELLAHVEKRLPGVPAVLATGYAELPADAVSCHVEKLSKPFDQAALQVALGRAVAPPRRRVASPAATPGGH
jgi:PAS domain S-box-containing protein